MNVHIAYTLQPLFHKNNLYQIVLQTVRTVSTKSWDFSRIPENHAFQENSSAFICTNPPSSLAKNSRDYIGIETG